MSLWWLWIIVPVSIALGAVTVVLCEWLLIWRREVRSR